MRVVLNSWLLPTKALKEPFENKVLKSDPYLKWKKKKKDLSPFIFAFLRNINFVLKAKALIDSGCYKSHFVQVGVRVRKFELK